MAADCISGAALGWAVCGGGHRRSAGLGVVAKTLTDTAGERDKDGPGYLNASGADITEYKAALGRHWLQWQMGIGPDDQSGVSHLAHVISNAAILLELQLIQAENSNTEDG